ncbi:CAP domain-containing protein [Streptomyces sp. NPDC048717]|uniref:CAP domain-containing protein n=1 Tax=Streptomyces sp. NPDC048717 TaxID=3154928 RepID=UPI00342117C8
MGRHRGIRRGALVRTGLLGVSVAVVAGAIAVASGLVPGGDVFTFGSTSADGRQTAQAEQAPRLTTQGGASANAESPTGQRTGAPVANGSGNASPTPPASKPTVPAKPTAPAKPSPSKAAPSPEAPKPATPKPPRTAAPVAPAKPEAPKPAPVPVAPAPPEPAEKPASQPPAPVATPTPTPTPTPAPTAAAERPLAAREAAAEAEVVRLVNLERAKVGCSAVRADADLASLAGALSADMAARGFFDHTDPDGATPWARAAKAGVTGLGAENIARGQVDAAAVMASWMASDGHRANILNCTYTSLGVGVHFGSAGPWWTQDFGV